MSGFLKVVGTKIVDEDGQEVTLRGAGLGGWMTMENFIAADVLGERKSEFFFERFLVYFFTECDAAFFKSLSLNCIRVATYRHYFEDNLNPRVLKPDCFKYLDRVVMVYAKYGIYTIIDMHTAPGGQNGGWHSDHDSSRLQGREVDNLMNEPADPRHSGLVLFYDRVYTAI
ncbi:hypothetical protein AcV7_004773 [Taiwanofungus camphoratus]|nr:hypothetical protein AcV7_004773 [Antrodia cinnamomea]